MDVSDDVEQKETFLERRAVGRCKLLEAWVYVPWDRLTSPNFKRLSQDFPSLSELAADFLMASTFQQNQKRISL